MPLWAAILLGVLVSAAVGAALSLWREYDEPFGSAVLSALLGPIGWLIILFAADSRPVCGECLGRMIPKARRCRHCGMPSTPHFPTS